MIYRKNRYGRTAARVHDADGLARRPASTTIDIHAHIVVPQAAKVAQPHVDLGRVPLAHFADAATREINAQQEKDVAEVMTTIDRRLFDLDKMGIDIQVVAQSMPKSPSRRIVLPMTAWRNIARANPTGLSGSASLRSRSRSLRSANSTTS